MQDNVVVDKLAGEIERQHKEGTSYFRRVGFLTKWPEYERFKASDQWPEPTARNKHLPRPVFNIIEMIEDHKVANVMSEQINMIYSTQERDPQQDEDDDGELFSRYSASTWERLKQDEMNEEGLQIAANTGTGIWHYFWDNDLKGGNKYLWVGEMEGEILDPINVFFGNPQQRNVQKQPYILVSSREDIKAVKDYARSNGLSTEMVAQIKPDKDTQDEGYDMAKIELNDNGKVTVFTKYWKGKDKETGESNIYFCKVASGMTIKKPINTRLTRYPLAIMQWKRRKKSIHGIGDTEGLIPNQKAINLMFAMELMSAQNTGFPKLRYKAGAIDPSKITNAIGEMIEDRSPPGSVGVDFMNPGSTSGQAMRLVEAIVSYTRQMSGADEAATGKAPSADLNATAIMLLQKAAAIPIESIKRRFYSLIEDIGRIWEDFWKVKYNLPRKVILKDNNGDEYATEFNGSSYRGVEFDLKIDVGPSSTYSESLVLSSLNEARARGDINYEQYLRYAPKTVVPYRDRLMKELEQKKGIVTMIEQMIAQMPPQEQEQFAAMTPEQQLQFVQAMIAPPPPQGVPPEAVQQPNMMPEIGM
ncbi:hypothetical protein [Paenibacillus taiwanensis]|uniref:hypothetical protein n=1 Tax=Paenibacillus taiwanensis TaxID=401638 RepID=UPI00041043A9|nr:hypothetical protein [Paenibacillus taiwanensis]